MKTYQTDNPVLRHNRWSLRDIYHAYELPWQVLISNLYFINLCRHSSKLCKHYQKLDQKTLQNYIQRDDDHTLLGQHKT